MQTFFDLPGDGGPGEFVMKTHHELLLWVLGENRPMVLEAIHALRESIKACKYQDN